MGQDAVPKAIAVTRAIDAVMRRDRGRLLAGLIARFGDFQVAEDALQEAMIAAMSAWVRSGLPDNPAAWLMRAALNKGIDQIRHHQRETGKLQDYGQIADIPVEDVDDSGIPDARLRLIFACCHPGLEEKSRVALTLRTVCGLTTGEIARAFLDNETTMGQRLSRAKVKIRSKGIAYSVPGQEFWADRLDTVLSTIYLIFTTGYVSDDSGPRDLCMEAMFLMRLLTRLRSDDPEIEGALALMLFTESRRRARIDEAGANVPVELQDPDLWDKVMIAEAKEMLEIAVNRRQPGPFQIKAAIADCHMTRPRPDWPQIALLYKSLWRFEPTPVVALNHAVVRAELGQVDQALAVLDDLEPALSSFQPWYAARANLLERLGKKDAARQAYGKAIDMAPNDASRLFLSRRLFDLKKN